MAEPQAVFEKVALESNFSLGRQSDLCILLGSAGSPSQPCNQFQTVFLKFTLLYDSTPSDLKLCLMNLILVV